MPELYKFSSPNKGPIKSKPGMRTTKQKYKVVIPSDPEKSSDESYRQPPKLLIHGSRQVSLQAKDEPKSTTENVHKFDPMRFFRQLSADSRKAQIVGVDLNVKGLQTKSPHPPGARLAQLPDENCPCPNLPEVVPGITDERGNLDMKLMEEKKTWPVILRSLLKLHVIGRLNMQIHIETSDHDPKPIQYSQGFYVRPMFHCERCYNLFLHHQDISPECDQVYEPVHGPWFLVGKATARFVTSISSMLHHKELLKEIHKREGPLVSHGGLTVDADWLMSDMTTYDLMNTDDPVNPVLTKMRKKKYKPASTMKTRAKQQEKREQGRLDLVKQKLFDFDDAGRDGQLPDQTYEEDSMAAMRRYGFTITRGPSKDQQEKKRYIYHGLPEFLKGFVPESNTPLPSTTTVSDLDLDPITIDDIIKMMDAQDAESGSAKHDWKSVTRRSISSPQSIARRVFSPDISRRKSDKSTPPEKKSISEADRSSTSSTVVGKMKVYQKPVHPSGTRISSIKSRFDPIIRRDSKNLSRFEESSKETYVISAEVKNDDVGPETVIKEGSDHIEQLPEPSVPDTSPVFAIPLTGLDEDYGKIKLADVPVHSRRTSLNALDKPPGSPSQESSRLSVKTLSTPRSPRRLNSLKLEQPASVDKESLTEHSHSVLMSRSMQLRMREHPRRLTLASKSVEDAREQLDSAKITMGPEVFIANIDVDKFSEVGIVIQSHSGTESEGSYAYNEDVEYEDMWATSEGMFVNKEPNLAAKAATAYAVYKTLLDDDVEDEVLSLTIDQTFAHIVVSKAHDMIRQTMKSLVSSDYDSSLRKIKLEVIDTLCVVESLRLEMNDLQQRVTPMHKKLLAILTSLATPMEVEQWIEFTSLSGALHTDRIKVKQSLWQRYTTLVDEYRYRRMSSTTALEKISTINDHTAVPMGGLTKIFKSGIASIISSAEGAFKHIQTPKLGDLPDNTDFVDPNIIWELCTTDEQLDKVDMVAIKLQHTVERQTNPLASMFTHMLTYKRRGSEDFGQRLEQIKYHRRKAMATLAESQRISMFHQQVSKCIQHQEVQLSSAGPTMPVEAIVDTVHQELENDRYRLNRRMTSEGLKQKISKMVHLNAQLRDYTTRPGFLNFLIHLGKNVHDMTVEQLETYKTMYEVFRVYSNMQTNALLGVEHHALSNVLQNLVAKSKSKRLVQKVQSGIASDQSVLFEELEKKLKDVSGQVLSSDQSQTFLNRMKSFGLMKRMLATMMVKAIHFKEPRFLGSMVRFFNFVISFNLDPTSLDAETLWSLHDLHTLVSRLLGWSRFESLNFEDEAALIEFHELLKIMNKNDIKRLRKLISVLPINMMQSYLDFYKALPQYYLTARQLAEMTHDGMNKWYQFHRHLSTQYSRVFDTSRMTREEFHELEQIHEIHTVFRVFSKDSLESDELIEWLTFADLIKKMYNKSYVHFTDDEKRSLLGFFDALDVAGFDFERLAKQTLLSMYQKFCKDRTSLSKSTRRLSKTQPMLTLTQEMKELTEYRAGSDMMLLAPSSSTIDSSYTVLHTARSSQNSVYTGSETPEYNAVAQVDQMRNTANVEKLETPSIIVQDEVGPKQLLRSSDELFYPSKDYPLEVTQLQVIFNLIDKVQTAHRDSEETTELSSDFEESETDTAVLERSWNRLIKTMRKTMAILIKNNQSKMQVIDEGWIKLRYAEYKKLPSRTLETKIVEGRKRVLSIDSKLTEEDYEVLSRSSLGQSEMFYGKPSTRSHSLDIQVGARSHVQDHISSPQYLEKVKLIQGTKSAPETDLRQGSSRYRFKKVVMRSIILARHDRTPASPGREQLDQPGESLLGYSGETGAASTAVHRSTLRPEASTLTKESISQASVESAKSTVAMTTRSQRFASGYTRAHSIFRPPRKLQSVTDVKAAIDKHKALLDSAGMSKFMDVITGKRQMTEEEKKEIVSNFIMSAPRGQSSMSRKRLVVNFLKAINELKMLSKTVHDGESHSWQPLLQAQKYQSIWKKLSEILCDPTVSLTISDLVMLAILGGMPISILSAVLPPEMKLFKQELSQAIGMVLQRERAQETLSAKLLEQRTKAYGLYEMVQTVGERHNMAVNQSMLARAAFSDSILDQLAAVNAQQDTIVYESAIRSRSDSEIIKSSTEGSISDVPSLLSKTSRAVRMSKDLSPVVSRLRRDTISSIMERGERRSDYQTFSVPSLSLPTISVPGLALDEAGARGLLRRVTSKVGAAVKLAGSTMSARSSLGGLTSGGRVLTVSQARPAKSLQLSVADGRTDDSFLDFGSQVEVTPSNLSKGTSLGEEAETKLELLKSVQGPRLIMKSSKRLPSSIDEPISSSEKDILAPFVETLTRMRAHQDRQAEYTEPESSTYTNVERRWRRKKKKEPEYENVTEITNITNYKSSPTARTKSMINAIRRIKSAKVVARFAKQKLRGLKKRSTKVSILTEQTTLDTESEIPEQAPSASDFSELQKQKDAHTLPPLPAVSGNLDPKIKSSMSIRRSITMGTFLGKSSPLLTRTRKGRRTLQSANPPEPKVKTPPALPKLHLGDSIFEMSRRSLLARQMKSPFMRKSHESSMASSYIARKIADGEASVSTFLTMLNKIGHTGKPSTKLMIATFLSKLTKRTKQLEGDRRRSILPRAKKSAVKRKIDRRPGEFSDLKDDAMVTATVKELLALAHQSSKKNMVAKLKRFLDISGVLSHLSADEKMKSIRWAQPGIADANTKKILPEKRKKAADNVKRVGRRRNTKISSRLLRSDARSLPSLRSSIRFEPESSSVMEGQENTMLESQRRQMMKKMRDNLTRRPLTTKKEDGASIHVETAPSHSATSGTSKHWPEDASESSLEEARNDSQINYLPTLPSFNQDQRPSRYQRRDVTAPLATRSMGERKMIKMLQDVVVGGELDPGNKLSMLKRSHIWIYEWDLCEPYFSRNWTFSALPVLPELSKHIKKVDTEANRVLPRWQPESVTTSPQVKQSEPLPMKKLRGRMLKRLKLGYQVSFKD